MIKLLIVLPIAPEEARLDLPILMAGVLYFMLPESLRFLAARNPRDPRIPGLLRRVDPSLELTGGEEFVMVLSEASSADAVRVAALQNGF